MAKRRVAIGHHRGWTPLIAERIDYAEFAPTFATFDGLDLSRFDVVLPTRIEHYPLVRSSDCRAVVPSPEVVALCDDKLALSRALIARGFGDHVPTLYESAPDYPCVVKPRHGEYGEGCAVIDRLADVPPAHFLQELIEGDTEYAVHVLRVGGRIHYIGAVRYTMAGPSVMRGSANTPLETRIIAGDKFADFAGAVLAALDYEGTACLNLKLDGRTPKLFEINPRFGGSLAYDVNRYLRAYCEAVA